MPPLRWTGAFVYKENKGIYYREITIFLALPRVGATFTWKSRHFFGVLNATFCPKQLQPEHKAVPHLGLLRKPYKAANIFGLTEKLAIARTADDPCFLNRRNELAQRCRHKHKFKLRNFKK